jgi:hypothetical protein
MRMMPQFGLKCQSAVLAIRCSSCWLRESRFLTEVWVLNERLLVREKFGDKLLATRELFGVVVCPTIPIHPQSLGIDCRG